MATHAFDPGQEYPRPVPVLSAEDQEFYYPSNFVSGQFNSEDIPSPETYKKRMEKLAAESPHRATSTIIPVVPKSAVPSWSGRDDTACDPADWVYTMVRSDIEEIERALEDTCGLNRPDMLHNINPETFVLPTIGEKLRSLAKASMKKEGILLVRGLDPNRYTLMENMVIFAGLSAYVSTERGVQNRLNDLIVHVRDSGTVTGMNHYRRETFTYSAQPFHTDYAPLIMMYVVQAPLKGGRCMWASSLRIYEDLAETRPEVLAVLEKPDWPFQKYTEDGTQVDAVDPRPLLYWDDGRPFFFFSRRNLTGSPRSSRTSSIPPITDIQADALDALHFSALKHCIRHRPVNGELQIINNLSVVHCREHFVDPDNESGRHLMRIWLRNDDIYHANLDHVLTRVFGDVFAPARIERAKWEVTGFNEWDALVDETSHTST